MGDFRFVSIAHIHRLSFMILDEVTRADQRMNPLHFWSNLANIQIRINPEKNINLDLD